jgi:hypothetical protein
MIVRTPQDAVPPSASGRVPDSALRTLSSAQTPLMTLVLPVIWISAFGLATLGLWMGAMHGRNGEAAAPAMKWLFLAIWLAGSTFFLWFCVGLKRVRVDTRALYVSNYLREISVPLSEVEDVTEIRWINLHPVTIHLRADSPFGRKISFMPTARVFGLWTPHPVVAELKRLAADAGR